MEKEGTRKRVVILGAGSAGLSAAMELKKAGSLGLGLEITLVDQHNYHLFLPLLYQVVTGGGGARPHMLLSTFSTPGSTCQVQGKPGNRY